MRPPNVAPPARPVVATAFMAVTAAGLAGGADAIVQNCLQSERFDHRRCAGIAAFGLWQYGFVPPRLYTLYGRRMPQVVDALAKIR